MMNQDFLNMITNKKDKRLAILLLLSQEKPAFKSEELEKLLNVTKATLKRDLLELRELFPTQLTIEISESITILVNENYTIFELLKLLLLEDPALFIFFKLISEESLNFYKCCEELYISETTLKRYIIRINKHLATYKIKLSYFPIRFVGSEINIRYFYIKILETFNYLEIDYQSKLITSFCLEFEQRLAKTSMKNLEINFKKLFLWLTINTLRTKKQYFINLPDIDLNIIEKTNLHRMLEQQLEHSYFLQSIPAIEKKFIALILWDCLENDFTFLFSKQSSDLTKSLGINDTSLQTLHTSLKQLAVLKKNTCQTAVLDTLLCSFFVLKKLSQFLPNYYMFHPEIKKYLLNTHHELYEKWELLIKKTHFLMDDSVDTQMLGLQLTLLSLLNGWYQPPTYKVAIDLNTPSSYRWLIHSILKEKLSSDNIDIQAIQLSHDTIEKTSQLFDLLITNYPLELPPAAPVHLQLCKYPTIQEIERTVKKITQLKEKFKRVS